MKKKIKELRIKIDGLSQLVKNLRGEDARGTFVGDCLERPYINSEECLKAYDSLILAKAWLGKVLQELESDSPYKNDGKRKTVKDIEETADKAVENVVKNLENFCKKPWSKKSHIEKVDWIREEIRLLIFRINELPVVSIQTKAYPKLELYIEYSNKYLSEARFWLGFELGRIKKELK